MLYATNTGTLPAADIVETASATSPATFVFQLPNQRATGCEAILSIDAASAGRLERQLSAVCCALDVGSTNSENPASGLTDDAGSTAGVPTPPSAPVFA